MKRKDIMIILIPTLIFVILWVIFNVYHNYLNSTISESVNVQINPINPTFDTGAIEQIKSRESINISQIVKEPVASSSSLKNISPTPIVEPTIVQATTGGTIR